MSEGLPLQELVRDALAATWVVDMHTHLFPASFGQFNLWGIDELLTYHYLIAEALRIYPERTRWFWGLSKVEQADWIWRVLFLERTPLSEACRGVLTVLRSLGLDPALPNLNIYREYYRETPSDAHVERILKLARVRSLVMTNDPFDEDEIGYWQSGCLVDPRFRPALRLDRLLNDWPEACRRLQALGYEVEVGLSEQTAAEIRRFLEGWLKQLDPVYLAVSLPPTFAYPEASARGRLLDKVVLPICRDYQRSLALMIGVKRLVNPALNLAGDSVGRADIRAIEDLCAKHPENRFLVTMLSRENQHELAVTARKFGNLMPFGCWWFLNIPSMIQEVTAIRLDLLGLDFIPQHSDARVLDQLVYKWANSRAAIAPILADRYEKLAQTGWDVTEANIRRDVERLFVGNFEGFVQGQRDGNFRLTV